MYHDLVSVPVAYPRYPHFPEFPPALLRKLSVSRGRLSSAEFGNTERSFSFKRLVSTTSEYRLTESLRDNSVATLP
jgi:hypothetical protein